MNMKVAFKKAGLVLKKHSPEILVGVGVVSLFGAVGTAIWKTATCDDILDEHEKGMKDAEDHVNEQYKKIKAAGKDVKDGKIVYDKADAEEDIKLLQTKQWMKTVGKIAWHYTPTIALTAISATSFLGAFCIIKSRYTMVVGALAATTSAFEKYRQRVIEDQGEDKDFEYRYGYKKTLKTVKNEDGAKEKIDIWEKSDEEDIEELEDGIFTFVFDDRSGEFYRDMRTNIISLNGIRATMDLELSAEGFVTAKDIFKRLDVWDQLTKKQRRLALKWGYYDNGDTHVDFDLYSVINDGQLILELKGLKPLDTLID